MNSTAPRLLIVTTVASTISHFLLPYIEHFRSLGWTVDAGSAHDRNVERIQCTVDQWHELPLSRSARSLLNPRSVSSLRGLIDDGNYDIVHVHTPIAAFTLRLAVASLATGRRPAVVYTAHGFHFVPHEKRWTDWPYRAAERIGGRYTDRLIVINSADATAAIDYKLLPAGHVAQMPGIGIDLDLYRRTPSLDRSACALRSSLGVQQGEHIVSMLAEFAPGKNHETLIEAFARTGREDMHLVFAGGGDATVAGQIRARSKALDLHRRVHFLGEIDDVRPVLTASSATALPSRREIGRIGQVRGATLVGHDRRREPRTERLGNDEPIGFGGRALLAHGADDESRISTKPST